MSTLFELTAQYRLFSEQIDIYADMIEAGDMPEEAFWDTVEALEGEVNEKVDSLACIYKEIMYEAAALKAEAERLKERQKRKEAEAERLKAYIETSMKAAGISKVETARNKLSFRKSTKLEIADEDTFVAWAQEYNPDLLTFKQPDPNKVVIKKILQGGQSIEGCRLAENMNLQLK
jgi:regulator of replication initiation timing